MMSLVEIARSHLHETDSRPFLRRAAPVFAPHDRPNWCGIFVRAVWLEGGLVVPEWEMGSGNTGYLHRTDNPKPGDLVCWRGSAGHQSLFVEREGGRFRDIGGNGTGTDKAGRVSYSCVYERWHDESKVLAYFSAPPVVADTLPPPPPPPPAEPPLTDPVRGAQAALARAGYYPARVDGIWGPISAAAGKRWLLEHFQLIVR